MVSAPEVTPLSPLSQKTKNWWQKRFGRIIGHVSVDTETTATFLPTGRAVIDAQKKLISEATSHSYHQTYSLDLDRVGQEFLHTLREKKQQSPTVQQHILVDNSIAWWNANGTVARHDDAQKQKDETFQELNRLEEEGTAVVRVTNWFHFWNLLHSNPFHRDHKKITTADGKKAIIGSVNTGVHHDTWLDAGVLLEGPTAKVIEHDIEDTLTETNRWVHAYKADSIKDYIRRGYWKEVVTDPDKFKDDLIGSLVRNPQRRGRRTIIHSPSGDEIHVGTDSFYRPYREATRMAYELLHEAQKGDTVDITSPYPGMMILTNKMILAARKKGVEVNLHMPSNNNYVLYNPRREQHPVMRKLLEINLALWKKRLKHAGITIYEYEGDNISQGMIHFKSVSLRKADGRQKVLIGSMNLSMGPLSGSNREIGVLLSEHHRQFMDEYNAFIRKVKTNSKKSK